MVLLTVATLSFGMPSSNVFAMTQTLAGPRMTGKWTGMQNGFGNLAGVVAPLLTGVIVQKTGVFYLAFLAVSLVALAGAASFLFLVDRVEPVDWKKPVEVTT
jgi:nitrate/nitrite transporter NarK